ncbi:SGNH/GDSL hydrolase family protein [Aminobacter aminovorans]|uniref:SGNH/GDSL hydrolase family protein n=1 Tax=Aminobacter aminovorans TaxID=83263 RepID=UPI002860EA2B|nr:SGNH/GDSL hydrolase family protein [Aminobacter aminovorans]MDR7225395.1 hypothetical protein [Aminobacter aminovorans]
MTGGFAAGAFTRAIFIRTTKGIEYVYALAGNVAGVFGNKGVGNAVSEVPFDWTGRSTHQSYQFQFAELCGRANQAKKWSLLLNGSEVLFPRNTLNGGEVIAIGFGVFGDQSISAVLTDLVRVRRDEQGGKTGFHIGVLGNSLSDPAIHGNWDQWMREYLDYSLGARVISLTNLAVSGDNTLGIYNQALGGALGNSNYAVIFAPGTNDTQQAVPTSTTTGNLNALIDLLHAEGRTPLLAIDPLFYTTGLGAGSGFTTSNYQLGAARRAAQRKLAITKGIACIDLQQVCGPIMANYLFDPAVDSVLRDNIHQTAAGHKMMGVAIARALMAMIAPKPTPAIRLAPIQVSGALSWLANGWTGTTLPPSYSITGDGFFRLHGFLDAGTKTDGTTIINLPAAYRPLGHRVAACRDQRQHSSSN